MTIEGIRKATEYFLKTIEEENIFKFNSELWAKYAEHYKNFTSRRNLFFKTLQKIGNKINDGTLSDEEAQTFMVQIQVWSLASALELVKLLLIVLVNPKKVILDPEKLMYGQVIKAICKEIRYDENLKNKTFDNFMVDFRNAIFHNKYNITNNGIIYKNFENQSISFTNEQLNEKNNEATEIFKTISEFADKKASEINEQTDELERKSRFER